MVSCFTIVKKLMRYCNYNVFVAGSILFCGGAISSSSFWQNESNSDHYLAVSIFPEPNMRQDRPPLYSMIQIWEIIVSHTDSTSNSRWLLI